jgi:FkbM family methyltransferase
MDVGSQLGVYSLFAAKMGRDVVTVEPFYDNIIRIHKAATQENIQNKITLLKNALSNKRNEIKMLQPDSSNNGGQSLLQNKDKTFTKDENNKYLVETILFDDIIPYLPKNAENKEYKKAILKIDIEGFEPYAFQHADKLFKLLDIPIIYMEWGNLPRQTDAHNLIVDMINFLYSQGLRPYGNNLPLQKDSWLSWPWDIMWKKDGY